MGTITCQELIDGIREKLFDARKIRWADRDLFDDLKAIQRHIVFLKPNAYTVAEAIQLQAGTVQATPADSYMILDVVRNLGTSEAPAEGPDIRPIKRDDLTNYNPSWRMDPASLIVLHWMYEPEKNRSRFEIYPAQPASGMSRVEALLSKAPPDPENIDAAITLDDTFATPIELGLLWQAFAKDNHIADNAAKAANYADLYLKSLGIRDAKEAVQAKKARVQ